MWGFQAKLYTRRSTWLTFLLDYALRMYWNVKTIKFDITSQNIYVSILQEMRRV